MQTNPRFLDELAQRFTAGLPQPLRQAREDLERNFRSVVEAGLARLNLVTREEFDAQNALLARTREHLDRLAARLAEIETQPKDPG